MQVSTPSPTKGDRRRVAILDAVEELLSERPLAALSVERIANAAGITRSAFYFYFGSKGEAVAAALWRAWDDNAALADEFLNVGRTPSDSGPVVLGRALSGTLENWIAHEGLLLAMLDATRSERAIFDLWEEWIARFVDRVSAAIESERRLGRAPDGVPSRTLAEALLAMNERTLERLSRAGASHQERAGVLETLIAVWSQTIYGVSA